jgi:hypothetical protein
MTVKNTRPRYAVRRPTRLERDAMTALYTRDASERDAALGRIRGRTGRKPPARLTLDGNPSEHQIQVAVLAVLKKHPNVAWAERMNVGQFSAEHNGKKRWLRFGFPGLSDCIGQLTDGRFLAIEIKSHKGALTEAQTAFLNTVNRAGGRAGVARSIDEALRIVGEINER